MKTLEQRIEDIENRNKKVELDKSWETSLTRKVILILLTWISIGLYFVFIGVEKPWINSIVPAIGFMLSTLTMPLIKGFWAKHIKDRFRIKSGMTL